ncbi:hypothetical protein CPB83DRAFT_800864, partial [Crepidotus variabilis]
MAKYAGSGHQDPSTCLEGTRTTALDDIDEWKCDSEMLDAGEGSEEYRDRDREMDILWLTGTAGSGKTAIAQTVYERFRAEGLLVVQTSFFRSMGCTHPKYLPLSIAYQLAVANSSLKISIEAVVQADPAVVDASFDVQLQRLVVGPLLDIASRGRVPRVYVIVDGLDECGVEDDQIRIIRLIQGIVMDSDRHQHRRLPIRFLIASRPESWIQTTLLLSSAPIPAPAVFTVMLNQNNEANRDIQLFYETEFAKIRNDPRHVYSMTSISGPWPWPSEADIIQLVLWASGQFVYAKTIVRFVGALGYSPICRLDGVLRSHSHSHSDYGSGSTKSKLISPLNTLDALYTHILSSAVDWDVTRSVLGALGAFSSSLVKREAVSVVEVLLGLNVGDGYVALRNLHPVVYVPDDLLFEREREGEGEG